MNEPTIHKLHAMRLGAMANAWLEQNKSAKMNDLGFDERFAMLVDAEHLSRDNRRLQRLLKDAQLRLTNAAIEDIEASPSRGLDKATLRQLATCTWLNEHLNVLLVGATGVGKSYIACAFGQAVCRKGRRVLYRRLSRLLDELALGRVDGTYARLLARLSRIDVLVLDDWGLGSLKEGKRPSEAM